MGKKVSTYLSSGFTLGMFQDISLPTPIPSLDFSFSLAFLVPDFSSLTDPVQNSPLEGREGGIKKKLLPSQPRRSDNPMGLVCPLCDSHH